MVTKEKKKELLNKLKEGVINLDEEMVKKASHEVLEDGVDAYDAIMNGLAAGMEAVGELYDKKEYFVPEMLLASDALYAGLEILKPHIKKENSPEFTISK